MAARLLVAAALVRLAGAAPYEVVISGFCDAKAFLDGLTFRSMGVTASGAPWYKAVDHDQYIYWDPDCGGRMDGTPRWIIDSDPPDTQADADLDDDGLCNYHGRINSRDNTRLPSLGLWTMECTGGWRTKVLIVLELATSTTTAVTTTRTRTTRTRTSSTTSTTSTTTTSTTETATSTTVSSTTETSTTTISTSATGTETDTSTTVTSSTTTEEEAVGGNDTSENASEDVISSTSVAPEEPTVLVPANLTLTGACSFKGYLNGLSFELMGLTAEGTPYYKAFGEEEYLYHDADCDGRCTAPRWVLGGVRPQVNRTSDLDDDGRCSYHARVTSKEVGTERPPANATWLMYCGREWGWQNQTVFLHQVGKCKRARRRRCPFCPYAWVEEANSTVTTTTSHMPPMFLSEARAPPGMLFALALPVITLLATK